MRDMAEQPNITMKISGLGMFDRRWTVDSLRPWVLGCIEAFGTSRVVFATNWPVDRLFSSYPDLIDAYATIIAGFSSDQKSAMFAGNADGCSAILSHGEKSVSWSIASGLEGKGVIVTGAAGGIGAGGPPRLRHGRVPRPQPRCDLDAASVRACIADLAGGPHLAVAADLRASAVTRRSSTRVAEAFGRLDVLACLAAALVRAQQRGSPTSPRRTGTLQHDVNLKSTFFLNRAAAQAFARRAAAAASSISPRRAGGVSGPRRLGRLRGQQGRHRLDDARPRAHLHAKDRITVNAVSPGAADYYDAARRPAEAQLAPIIAQIPIGYMAKPSELAGTALPLLRSRRLRDGGDHQRQRRMADVLISPARRCA